MSTHIYLERLLFMKLSPFQNVFVFYGYEEGHIVIALPICSSVHPSISLSLFLVILKYMQNGRYVPRVEQVCCLHTLGPEVKVTVSNFSQFVFNLIGWTYFDRFEINWQKRVCPYKNFRSRSLFQISPNLFVRHKLEDFEIN